jgi:hypothetical protein
MKPEKVNDKAISPKFSGDIKNVNRNVRVRIIIVLAA